MERTSNGIEELSLGTALYAPDRDEQPIEGLGDAPSVVRCDASARRALQNLDPETERVLGEYTLEHRQFFDCWERHFSQFSEEPSQGDQGAIAQYQTVPQELTKYEEARFLFSARWNEEVSQFGAQADNELTRARIKRILEQAQMRDRVVSAWIHNIVSSYGGRKTLADGQVRGGEQGMEEASLASPQESNTRGPSRGGFLSIVVQPTRNRTQRKTF